MGLARKLRLLLLLFTHRPRACEPGTELVFGEITGDNGNAQATVGELGRNGQAIHYLNERAMRAMTRWGSSPPAPRTSTSYMGNK